MPIRTFPTKFASPCSKCHNVMPVGTRINWDTDTKKVWHATPCPPMVALPGPLTHAVQPLHGIVDFLMAARGRGLKYPKAGFVSSTGETLNLSLTGDKSNYPGSVSVKIDDVWQGYVTPSGMVIGSLKSNVAVLSALQAIADAPAEAATRHGRLTGCCAFCGDGLTAEGSTDVGYGPGCAKRWGLPYKYKPTPAAVAVPATVPAQAAQVAA